jgi:aspartate aminotransferase
MAERIIEMRSVLYDKLTNELKTPGDWSHIKSQIGMFRYVLLYCIGKKRMNELVV